MTGELKNWMMLVNPETKPKITQRMTSCNITLDKPICTKTVCAINPLPQLIHDTSLAPLYSSTPYWKYIITRERNQLDLLLSASSAWALINAILPKSWARRSHVPNHTPLSHSLRGQNTPKAPAAHGMAADDWHAAIFSTKPHTGPNSLLRTLFEH